MEKKLVVLVDGNNSLYRMYHTQPEMRFRNHRIESAKSTISYINRLRSGTAMGVPKQVVTVFDANSENFRHKLLPSYKCSRSGMPEDLKSQESLTKDAIRAMGLSVIEKEGYEGDDALGMIANYYQEENCVVMIVTTDKDMMQLVNNNIVLFNPISKKIIDHQAVIDKFGVEPNKIAELLAIMGDNGDDIVGIDGVGEKTAAKWLNNYKSIDEIIKNASNIGGAAGKKIEAFSERLMLNIQLTTINSNHKLLTEDEIKHLNYPVADLSKCKQINTNFGLSIVPIETKAIEKVKSIKNEIDNDCIQGSLF